MTVPARTGARLLAAATATALALTGCGSGSSSASSSGGAQSEAQSAASGDIPDNQQFLVYRNAGGGYSMKYPEGWARKGSATALTFADKDNQVRVTVKPGAAPTLATAKASLTGSATPSSSLKVTSARMETIGGTPAIHITYEARGPADPVTGKRLTLMVDRYVLGHGGKVATVDESTPVGVDNVDAYRLMINSFKWS